MSKRKVLSTVVLVNAPEMLCEEIQAILERDTKVGSAGIDFHTTLPTKMVVVKQN